jgi:hypothetical protein
LLFDIKVAAENLDEKRGDERIGAKKLRVNPLKKRKN